MSKNLCKKISKNLNGKYNQKLLDHAKQSATDALKTNSKRVIQNTRSIWRFVGNKVPITLPQNNSETNTNQHNKEIPKERFLSPERKTKNH